MCIPLDLIALQRYYEIEKSMSLCWRNTTDEITDFDINITVDFVSYFSSDPIGEIRKHQSLFITTPRWYTQYVLLATICWKRKSSIREQLMYISWLDIKLPL